MPTISPVFRRFIPQLLHIIVMPVFFFAFMLIYMPFGVEAGLGREWFGVHLTIMSCIVLLSYAVLRPVYYFIPMKINYTLYIVWCLSEIIFTSFFLALYLWLVMDKPAPYFEFLTTAFKYLALSLVIPYVILGLSLRLYEYHIKQNEPSENAIHRMRFHDHFHNLKIVLTPQAVLYIAAEENYVNIYYYENGKVREYVLRNSMKAIEELCLESGLVRCHRSYYINPAHVKVLRKDRDGIMYAELDADDIRHIPVSKKYCDRLSDML